TTALRFCLVARLSFELFCGGPFMNAASTKHPPRDFLVAFGLGKLSDIAADKVSMHLDTCHECRRQVAELSEDSLLEQLRQGHCPPTMTSASETLRPAMECPPKASQLPSSAPAELTNNGQYEIIREIGAGGMGVVYLARNRLMDRLEVL